MAIDYSLSPDMQLPVPTVGVAPGPEWAELLNQCMARIDEHDHTPGLGVKITPSGLNISADLPLNANNLTLTRSVQFLAQSALIADLSSIYVQSQDLYFNDAAGNPIRLTQNGSIAGTSGSISGLVAPASASYVALSGAFVWQSAANIAADLDARSLVLRNGSLSSYGMTVNPPTAMSADSSITLPAVPSVTSSILIDNTGLMTTQDTLQSYLPPGVVQDYAGSTIPSGWLPCDGTYYLRSSYPALFSAIGVTFGSTDGTNFAVPNLQGLVTAGANGGLGGLGVAGGEYSHTLSISEMPNHSHGVNDPFHSHNAADPDYWEIFTSTGSNIIQSGSGIQTINRGNSMVTPSQSGVSIQANGGGAAHNNIQPYMALNKIIKI